VPPLLSTNSVIFLHSHSQKLKTQVIFNFLCSSLLPSLPLIHTTVSQVMTLLYISIPVSPTHPQGKEPLPTPCKKVTKPSSKTSSQPKRQFKYERCMRVRPTYVQYKFTQKQKKLPLPSSLNQGSHHTLTRKTRKEGVIYNIDARDVISRTPVFVPSQR
jgi:hypothetical protein